MSAAIIKKVHEPEVIGVCPRCSSDPRPFTAGSDPRKCAFTLNDESESWDVPLFNASNWNCATMEKLRTLAEDSDDSTRLYSEDQWISTLRLPDDEKEGGGRFLVLSWYKHRGKTEGAWVIQQTEIRPLDLRTAEALIAERWPQTKRLPR